MYSLCFKTVDSYPSETFVRLKIMTRHFATSTNTSFVEKSLDVKYEATKSSSVSDIELAEELATDNSI